MKKIHLNKIIIPGLILVIVFLISLQFLIYNSLNKSGIENNKVIIKPVLEIGKNNGIVTNIWFEDKKQLEKFIENDIKYLFVDVGDIDKNGKSMTEEKELKHFLDFIDEFEKEKAYEFVLLPYNEIIIGQDGYSLNSNVFVNNVINNYKHLVDLGFDGSHVDIEAIPFSQRGDYLEFLEELRRVIGNKMLTVYSGSMDENPNVWEWNYVFYKDVADRVDIIKIPSYDFHFTNKKDYQDYVKNQIAIISTQEWNAKFMFTVPTHKSSPETIENSLEAYNKEIVNHETNPFIGIVIFAEWTTDNSEWEIFEEYVL